MKDTSELPANPIRRTKHMGVELTSGDPPPPCRADFVNVAQVKALGDYIARQKGTQDAD